MLSKPNSDVRTARGSYNKFLRAFTNNFSAWMLLLPAVILLFIIAWKPIFEGMFLSFFKMQGYTMQEFVGFKNYTDVLSDPIFPTVLGNTFKYVMWSLLIGFIPPIAIAIMINEVRHTNGFIKFCIYCPAMVPAVATALIWYFLFLPGDAGIVNLILGKIGVMPLSWLQDKNLSIPTIIFTMSWKGFGASALIYLAALQGVNHELYEAATIDGAGVFRKIWSITLPQVSGIVLLMFVRQIVGVFQVMMEPMIMTDGGPNNASLSLNLHTYLSAFRYYQIDKALALSVITFAILIVMTIFYFMVKKKVEE